MPVGCLLAAHRQSINESETMSRKRQRNRFPAPKPANPNADAPAQSPGAQPVQSGMRALVSVVVLLACIALAVWVGRDLYAIVFEGEICRPRHGCESWSSHPVSLGAQCLGFMLLLTIFVGVAYGALQVLLGRAGDERA